MVGGRRLQNERRAVASLAGGDDVRPTHGDVRRPEPEQHAPPIRSRALDSGIDDTRATTASIVPTRSILAPAPPQARRASRPLLGRTPAPDGRIDGVAAQEQHGRIPVPRRRQALLVTKRQFLKDTTIVIGQGALSASELTQPETSRGLGRTIAHVM